MDYLVGLFTKPELQRSALDEMMLFVVIMAVVFIMIGLVLCYWRLDDYLREHVKRGD